ncbi:MAG: DUF4199 domain-containing protein [Cytophagaceae bacterium]|nr:DUF4199 domain-containing protein [Cytophagaceae bacterium]
MFKRPFLRYALLSGLLAGLICFGYFLLLYTTDALPLGTRRNIGLIFIWICMALGVWQFGRAVRRPIQFLEAFLICVITVGLASALDSFLVVGFIKYVDPGMLPTFIAHIKQQALTDRATIDEQFGSNEKGKLIDYAELIRQIDRINLRSIFMANFSILRIVFSLLYSALIAVFFRRLSQSSTEGISGI